MKIAFNTWVYSSFPVWVPSYPLQDTIERIAAIGYDGIEIGAASPHAFPDYLDAKARKNIRRMLEQNRLSLAAMLPAPGGGPGFNSASPLAAERAATVEQYKKVVDLCSDLGGRTVIYVAGWQVFGTTRDEAWSRSREALTAIAEAARAKGVTIVIEPTSADSNLVDSADDAIRMMKEAGAPNVKLMFDTYHAIYRNEVSSDYVHRMGRDLHHVHLADAGRAAPSDSGRADYRALITALAAQGYEGYLSMEIGFDRRAVEPDRIARDAYNYIKPLVDAASGKK
ncbi:MAG: sugar phosphate isomerase/epimerase family protein [Parvibaculaceae bacterium]